METYRVFLTRNPFGLKNPPSKAPGPKPETTRILRLTGMRSLNGEVMVMFALSPIGGAVEFLSIKEGDSSRSVEVLEGGVNITAGTAKVKVRNVLVTLSLGTDGDQGAF